MDQYLTGLLGWEPFGLALRHPHVLVIAPDLRVAGVCGIR
jgi:hypothetical protein